MTAPAVRAIVVAGCAWLVAASAPVIGGLTRVVSRLVGAGVEVNVRNARGQTPLALVSKRDDRKATADLLRSFGAME